MPEPILRSPTLQRMRTFTKVASLDLQDQKAKKMAQDQTHLFAEVAKAMDLHTLLELVRKDVYLGFDVKCRNIYFLFEPWFWIERLGT